MSTIAALLERIERFCAAQGIAESTFGLRAANDGKLMSRLRAGRVTLRTVSRIDAFIAAAPEADSAGGEGRGPTPTLAPAALSGGPL